MSNIKINVYQADNGTWYGAMWIDKEFDGSFELGCDDDCKPHEAVSYAETMPLEVEGTRTVLLATT